LSVVSDEIRSDFTIKLKDEWLVSKGFDLLYRGSRDGMTAASFHEKCDGQGPTLTIIVAQSEYNPVSVFGGYASLPWESTSFNKRVNARDSFLFTVVHRSHGIVRLPVDRSSKYADSAMLCHSGRGPTFGSGGSILMTHGEALSIQPSGGARLDSGFCGVASGCTYGDPLGQGFATFTGGFDFLPVEMEVWRVL
jgi:hypothetical protein